MKEKIVIIGASGHAKVVIDIVEKEHIYNIIGIIDPIAKVGEDILGYKILGNDEDLLYLNQKYGIKGCVVAIGNNQVRKSVVAKIRELIHGIKFVTTIHPSAQIGKNVEIGMGTVIMAGVVVNSCSRVGNFVIINTNASLDHDCFLGDYASLAPNVSTGGNVEIGETTEISIGANIAHNIRIGKHTIIGAGAVVLSNIGDNVVAYGIPARIIRHLSVPE